MCVQKHLRIDDNNARKLKTTTLGKTSLEVSCLGAGLGEIGLLPDASIAGQLLNLELGSGINFMIPLRVTVITLNG
jgi:hypothetical protein